jgi:hypothetical protein
MSKVKGQNHANLLFYIIGIIHYEFIPSKELGKLFLPSSFDFKCLQ